MFKTSECSTSHQSSSRLTTTSWIEHQMPVFLRHSKQFSSLLKQFSDKLYCSELFAQFSGYKEEPYPSTAVGNFYSILRPESDFTLWMNFVEKFKTSLRKVKHLQELKVYSSVPAFLFYVVDGCCINLIKSICESDANGQIGTTYLLDVIK